jgi:hypothetical protein
VEDGTAQDGRSITAGPPRHESARASEKFRLSIADFANPAIVIAGKIIGGDQPRINSMTRWLIATSRGDHSFSTASR